MRHVILLLAAASSIACGDHPADRRQRLDAFLQEYVDSNRIGGAVVLALRDGSVVYERAAGWSDREAGRRMTTDAMFRIASMTKALTSIAIVILMEEGKISPNDPVSRFIPAYAHTTVATRRDGAVVAVPAVRQITIHHLLTHTAGVSYGYDSIVARQYAAKGLGVAAGYAGWYLADKTEPICTTMERLATLPFVRQPGETFVYGYSSDILGCIVERASGMSLDRFVRERITGPLHMRDTYFFVPPAKRERLVAVYASDATNHAVRAPDGSHGQGHYVDGPRRSFSGGAGLVSTARDYARLLQMLLNGGELDGARILSAEMVDAITPPNHGSYGWAGAYGSRSSVDPKERLVLVFMLNQLPDSTDLAVKFLSVAHHELVK